MAQVPFLPLQGGFHNPQLRKWQCRGKQLSPDCFMFPIFVSTDDEKMEEIPTFPGQFKVGKKKLVEYLKPMVIDGLKSVLLFPVDMERGQVSWLYNESDNPVIEGIGIIKNAFPHVTVACDVCLCGAEANGLCYIMTNRKDEPDDDRVKKIYEAWVDYDSDEERYEAKKIKEYFTVDHEATMYQLRSIACKYAMHGADIVAPSDMNDGRVGEIDRALVRQKLRAKCAIMSYSAKFASSLYGPFRDTCDSKPIFNSREGKQLPVGSSGLANRAISRDVAENADIVMVKPATMYLDVVRDIKKEYPHHPIAAYQVSGEYAMFYHSAEKGVFDLKTILYESYHCMQRAGVDVIISYFTPKVLKWLKEDEQEQMDLITKQMKRLEDKAKEDEE